MLERLDFLSLRELVHPRRVAVDHRPERRAELAGVSVMMAVREDKDN